MTDTWVFLIREPDWDSDRYLPENLAAHQGDFDEDMAAARPVRRGRRGARRQGGRRLRAAEPQVRRHREARQGRRGATSGATPRSPTAARSSPASTPSSATRTSPASIATKVPTGNVVEMRKVHPFE